MNSHSHPATQQDLWVLSKSYNSGTFCEVGAFDGIKHSNTLLLEQLGWRGILIEAHKPFYEQCRYNRPEATCRNLTIGARGGSGMLMVGGQYTGLIRTMPEAFYQEHLRRGNKQHQVTTTPLIDIIREVDYLSIDTEGGELGILKNWLESGGQARLITVEFRYDTAELHRIERLAEDHGYELNEIRGFDLCLIRQ